MLQKGSGYHYDLLLMGLLVGLCSILGFPWICAAAVRSIQHFNILSVFTKAYPGAKPQLTAVYEQRITNFVIHVLISESCIFARVTIFLYYRSSFSHDDFPYQVDTNICITGAIYVPVLCFFNWNTARYKSTIAHCPS